MTRLLVVVAANVSLVLACGCGANKPAEADVKGTVKFDGEPLADGTIVFITPGDPADAIGIKGGAFSGKAKAGENRRVEVYSYKDAPPHKDPMTGEMLTSKMNIVAPPFNTQSKLKATITEGGENSFHFDVASQ